MLLLLSHWTRGRGAEESLVTDRQEISASCLKLKLGIIFPCQQTGLEDCSQPASLANSYKHIRFTVRTIFYSLGNPEFKATQEHYLVSNWVQNWVHNPVHNPVHNLVYSPVHSPVQSLESRFCTYSFLCDACSHVAPIWLMHCLLIIHYRCNRHIGMEYSLWNW